MAPLNQIEITIPEEVSLRLRPRLVDADQSDEASETSEISLDLLAKERALAAESLCGQNSWNPDGSDYTLDCVLRSGKDDVSIGTADKESLMTSDYSLNKRLGRSQSSLRSEKADSADSMQQSFCASQSSFITSRSTTKSVLTDITESTSCLPERKVKFYSRVRILRVTNRLDLAPSQVKGVWYSRAEFREIRGECFDTIKLMQDEEMIDEEEGFCARGLEYKTKGAYRLRQRNKIEVRQAVFEEQEFQQDSGMPDPDWIARVSQENSSSCVNNAIETAKGDAKEARGYLGLD